MFVVVAFVPVLLSFCCCCSATVAILVVVVVVATIGTLKYNVYCAADLLGKATLKVVYALCELNSKFVLIIVHEFGVKFMRPIK